CVCRRRTMTLVSGSEANLVSNSSSSQSPLPTPDDVARVVTDGVSRRQINDLIEQIKESTEKLVGDQASRGDLKILSRALRELRYAFKVFTPYRSAQKVTVFGSARTRPEAPAYQQAVRFGRAM